MRSINIQIATLFMVFLLSVVFLLAGCDQKSTMAVTYVPLKTTKSTIITHAPQVKVETQIQTTTDEPTATSSITSTSNATNTDLPTDIPTATKTQTQSLTPTFTQLITGGYINPDDIVIYLIHVGTGGPVACGDSLVAIRTGQSRTGNIEKDVQIAVNALFSIGQYSLALYNATYLSTLRFSGFQLNKGEAIVDLSGSYIKPENSCDASRFRAQVWTTIQQFPEINKAIPRYRGKLLGDLLYAQSK